MDWIVGNDDEKTIWIGKNPVDTVHEPYLRGLSIKIRPLDFHDFHPILPLDCHHYFQSIFFKIRNRYHPNPV